MRFLAAVFPPAWFVVILRHPLSVCRRVEWHMRLLCAHNWLNAYEWAAEDIAAGELPAYVTYYEHWVTHPVDELRAMTPLLGLSQQDFDWSTVIKENSDMNLKSHASSGCVRRTPFPTHAQLLTQPRAGGAIAGRSRAPAFLM